MYKRSGPPPWLIFLVSIALVMGTYYLWLGTRTYLSTGGLGVEGATEQAAVLATTRAVVIQTEAEPTDTLFPTFTPIPPCQDWVVSVSSAIVRGAASTSGPIIATLNGGDPVCVIEQVQDTDWYLVDADPRTRRIEEGYMRNDIIEPANPTPTATLTITPLPTITPITPTETPTPPPTPTNDPDISPTPSHTPMPTVTQTPTPRDTATNTPLPARSI